MTLGNPGTLALLQQRGYKTFSDFWDESYDTLGTDIERAEVICNNLKKLSKLTKEELIALRIEIKPILEHNLNIFKQELKDNFYKGGALKKLEKILRKLIE